MRTVVLRSYRAIHFAAALFYCKIIAIDVIYISIAVIIHTGLAVKLGLVDPHIGCQVLVTIVHTSVSDSHDHVLASGSHLPRGEEIDIRTFHLSTPGTEIHIMPLVIQLRIIERIVGIRRILYGIYIRDDLHITGCTDI